MANALVIVESPAKARTIEKFLGRGYEVVASMGHVRDLPKSQLGVDTENGFAPKYITIRGKGEVISNLRGRAKRASRVLLATDPDREGEAISWHLCHVLGLAEDDPSRITFHEITRDAVKRALAAPRPIDRQLVLAQQARRVLDRLVGYRLSPLLWRKVRGGLSAGRVQSVAVRLICDREAEIGAFAPEEYWTITARLRQGEQAFSARYWGSDGARRELHDESEAEAIVTAVGTGPVRVAKVTRRERRRNPAAPFTTATLQQEAARKLGFTVRRTMRLAQELYEGLSVGGEHVGLITYMRTDSVRVANQAVEEATTYVRERFGPEFAQARQRQADAAAQDAHEAVRPTAVTRSPESLSGDLGRDQLRLYRLIWERFVASQMAPAVLDTVTADLAAPGGHTFRASGSSVKFAGFMVLYVEGRDQGKAERADAEASDDEAERLLPALAEGDRPALLGLDPVQHFTEPPPRYTEAMLVRALEEQGIGRPSTYAAIIETIESRGYVDRLERRFHPTELGTIVTDLLKSHFPDVVDVAFTAEMERDLDRVETGERDWQQLLADFYGPFSVLLEKADGAIEQIPLAEEVTDEVCPECGKPMVVRRGRFGPFLACSGYPECKTTKPILERTGVTCGQCGQGEMVVRRSRKGRTFYGCERYPECNFVLWNRPAGPCPQCQGPMVEKRNRQSGPFRECTLCGHREGGAEQEEALEAGEAQQAPPVRSRSAAARTESPAPSSTARRPGAGRKRATPATKGGRARKGP